MEGGGPTSSCTELGLSTKVRGAWSPWLEAIDPRLTHAYSFCVTLFLSSLALLNSRSAGTEDADFEDRLAKLRAAKGTKGRGQGGTKSKTKEAGSKVYDYTGETVFYEGGPSAGDLAVNVALGATLLWLVSTPLLVLFQDLVY